MIMGFRKCGVVIIAITVSLGTSLATVSAKESPADHLAVVTARTQEVAAVSLLTCHHENRATVRNLYRSALIVGSMRLAALVRDGQVSEVQADTAAATWLNPGAIAEIRVLQAAQARTSTCSASQLNATLMELAQGARLLRERAPKLRIPADELVSFHKRRAQACALMAWASTGFTQDDSPAHVAHVWHYILRTCGAEFSQYESEIRLNEGLSKTRAHHAAHNYLTSPRARKVIFHWADSASHWILE